MDNDRHMVSSGRRRIATIVLPSIGNIIFIAVFLVLVFGSGHGLLNDGDTGYHIRTGEEILKSWRIPAYDVYSAHVPPLPWTAHEWLSEVVMACISKLSGLTGLVLFFALLLAATHWLLFFVLKSKSDNFILIIAVTCIATASSASHWLARPHAFSLLFTLVWYWFLDRFQYRNHRTLYYLPLLMVFWVNMHGGYIIGILILLVYLGGNLIHSWVEPPQKSKESRRKAHLLFRISIITILTCLINPIGYEILLFPFKLASDRFVMDHVSEFMSPNFHEVLPFKYMLLATMGMLALSRRPLNLVEVGLLLLLTYMALYSARHVSLFAIVVSPMLLKCSETVMSGLATPVVRFWQTRNCNLAQIDTKVTGYFWPAVSVLSVAALALLGSLQFTFDEKRFPVAAAEFLKRETLHGKMFNNDEFGDYFIYALWPKYRVFMDGRSDMYGEKLGGAYLKVANVLPGWKETLARNSVNWVVFDTRSALTAALVDDIGWQPIYSDNVATIFVKKDMTNETLLAKYPAVDVKIGK